jgi:DNA-3-methyladenine glycosylase
MGRRRTDYQILGREFYLAGAVTVARGLLGMTLVHDSPEGLTAGRIIETEAYAGRSDAACHSYNRNLSGSAHRTDVMFGPGGHAYIYLIYGVYNCFNAVANVTGEPEAVLIRSLEPLAGAPLMARRRGLDEDGEKSLRRLCNGPGKLCIAMGITKERYGEDLTVPEGLFIACGEPPADASVLSTPRINVDYSGDAAEYPYRFVIRDTRFLSTRRFITDLRKR